MAMKIHSIQNYSYTKPSFTGATVPHYHINRNNNDNNNKKSGGEFPEWARKGALAILVILAVKNDPAVHNFFKSADEELSEKTRNEFFEDVARLGKNDELYPATYHLNRFADVDNAEIKSHGRDSYNLDITLDKGKINTTVNVSPYSNNSLFGTYKDENGSTVRYKAVFSTKNPEQFEIQMRSKNNDKYIFGRTPEGEFYRIDGNKKVILNKKNVEKYQKSIENLPDFEDMDNFEFFTNKNDMWRKLNLILLSFLLFAEMMHDNAKRREKENEKENKD